MGFLLKFDNNQMSPPALFGVDCQTWLTKNNLSKRPQTVDVRN